MEIKNILKGKVVIVGIGNIMKGDDGFGPLLVEKLKDKTPFVCIDGQTAPENYTGKIAKENPDTILLVDAVHMDLNPGVYKILKKDEIANSGLTTHNMSPAMLIEFLENSTGAEIYLLGMQPKSINFGDEMSSEAKEALNNIAEEIK
ncbi:MAG: hydrogenase maturation peptidase HycI [Candidatus Omnitrophica bacterium]|nr:hydrogenase maturation peptidase HycI [Candidatus Omnitrophota bacterium]